MHLVICIHLNAFDNSYKVNFKVDYLCKKRLGTQLQNFKFMSKSYFTNVFCSITRIENESQILK